MLTVRLRNLLLTRISQQHLVQPFVRNKTRTDLVVMQPLLSLVLQLLGNIEIGMLGRLHNLCLHLESKGSKITIVYSSTSNDVFLNVLSQ